MACAVLAVPALADDAADAVLARVGDASITRADLTAFLRRTGMGGRQADGQPEAAVASAALERLVDERLLQAAIAGAGIDVDPAEVTAATDRLRSQLESSRGRPLEQLLERSGGDLAGLRRQIEFDLAVSKLIGPLIDDAARTAAFRKHHRDLDGTRMRASHIVLHPDLGGGDDAVAAAFRKAADIRAAILRHDLSFAEAAAIHSAGPSRHRGGDLGFLERHGEVHEVFAREAFSLDVGGVSQPFATPFGVHLVTVTAVAPGTATVETLRPRIDQLAAQDAIRELIARLRKTTPIAYSPGASHAVTAPPGGDALPPRPGGDAP